MLKLRPLGSNQTLLVLDNMTILFSYETPVAANTDKGFIRTSCRWSSTTSRHISSWLAGIEAKEVEQSVLDGLLSKIESR